MKILVVEDDPLQREVLTARLRSGDNEVIEAPSGEAAVASVLAADEIGLVMMDMGLPGIGGLEAAKRIRALDGWRGQVPIVAMSASPPPPDKKLAAVVDGFLPKDGGDVEAAMADGVRAAHARVVFDQQTNRVAPGMGKQVWDSLPRVTIIFTCLAALMAVVTWFTGGVRPQTAIDAETAKTELTALRQSVSQFDAKLEAVKGMIARDSENRVSHLEANFDGLREKLYQVQGTADKALDKVTNLTVVAPRTGH